MLAFERQRQRSEIFARNKATITCIWMPFSDSKLPCCSLFSPYSAGPDVTDFRRNWIEYYCFTFFGIFSVFFPVVPINYLSEWLIAIISLSMFIAFFARTYWNVLALTRHLLFCKYFSLISQQVFVRAKPSDKEQMKLTYHTMEKRSSLSTHADTILSVEPIFTAFFSLVCLHCKNFDAEMAVICTCRFFVMFNAAARSVMCWCCNCRARKRVLRGWGSSVNINRLLFITSFRHVLCWLLEIKNTDNSTLPR